MANESGVDGDKPSQQPPPGPVETDDFGLPIRRYRTPVPSDSPDEPSSSKEDGVNGSADTATITDKDAEGVKGVDTPSDDKPAAEPDRHDQEKEGERTVKDDPSQEKPSDPAATPTKDETVSHEPPNTKSNDTVDSKETAASNTQAGTSAVDAEKEAEESKDMVETELRSKRPGSFHPGHAQQASITSIHSNNEGGLSEFSHQKLTAQPEDSKKDDDEGWQEMPSYARYDMYDDDDRLIAREHDDAEDEKYAYGGLGGAGKGYTRVQMDEDAESATSMDDNTKYLFKNNKGTAMVDEDDDDARDAVSQMQTTKDLLTEGQRIAYVGVVRLEISELVKQAQELESTKKIKKEVSMAGEAMKMWEQKIMIRLYAHMDISEAEQVMIEQLAEHGVVPADLTPALYANARVKNPMAEGLSKVEEVEEDEAGSPPAYPDDEKSGTSSKTSEDTEEKKEEKKDTSGYAPMPSANGHNAKSSSLHEGSEDEEMAAEPPPPYEMNQNGEVPDAQTPSQMPTTEKIDIDLRWTVLCDLFLTLILDSVYDARSRTLLERVAKSLDIPWVDICRFEKRVTDALEMQQAAEKENWNEDEHLETRRKKALKKRYMMMGLATVGGGLVIGLSAGLLAPVIGAGLAAGFTTIGVAGTSGFLGGVGGAAIITSGAVASGGIIGVRAADKRTGAVKTFEYRPLHNNKRVNLVVTVSGWLTSTVDDVRLPFSTVDPVMGDLYSVLWEPELLTSMGDTIRILATEALTQSIQQVLASTILGALMGALQLPIILTKLSYLIDNPWAVSLDRATSAGKILADSLIERNLGTRPITLVGYSLGARVIFSCLQELAKRGAYGLIQNVYMFGSPIVVKKEEYLRARTVVSGRFVNGYNKTDWILGYLFRLTNGGIRRVAGLAPITDLPWLENFDATDYVVGHMEYRTAMPTLLMNCGWLVDSEEFTEIEDPDPDNHTERQRELINEIEAARRELEKEGEPKKSGPFGLFSRKRRAQRHSWELYEETPGSKDADGSAAGDKKEDRDSHDDSAYRGALFDVDAIRAELAKETQGAGHGEEELQIREIKSTLPPMKLDLSPKPSSGAGASHSSLPETRTAEYIPARPARPPTVDDYDDDAVQMSFDTDFDDKPTRSYGQPYGHTYGQAHGQGYGQTFPTDDALDRPPIKQSQTLPNLQLNDHWGDSDDEDFGKEKEMTLTFA